MLAILLPPADLRVRVTFAAVLLALSLTGAPSAHTLAAATSAAPSCAWSSAELGLAFTSGVGHPFGTAVG
jgi:hypothetical protein